MKSYEQRLEKKVQREVIFVFPTGLKNFKRCTKAQHTQEAFQRLE